MKQVAKTVAHRIRETATHWVIGGLFVTATGFAPEEWLSHTLHDFHIPEAALHLWSAGVDVRIVPIAIGMAIIALGMWWRNDAPATSHPLVPAAHPADTVASLPAGDKTGTRSAYDEKPYGAPPLPDKPSLAVLPFASLSGDPEHEYFADGIVGDIITALSRFPSLFVIARNSSFSYKGKTVNTRQVGRDLGVRYVLEGSIRTSGSRIRITSQLVQAETGTEIWAERYDRDLEDIFAVQDEITAIIAARLDNNIQKAEIDAVRDKDVASLPAYDCYLRGRALRQTSDPNDILSSRKFFEKAIAIASNFAPPYAELAYTFYADVAQGWNPGQRETLLIRGEALVRKAIAIDPTLSFAHWTMGAILLRQHRYDDAIQEAEKAIALNINDPESHAGLANIFSYMNRSAEAVPLMATVLRLDPIYPPLFDFYMGRALFLRGTPDLSIPYLRSCMQRVPVFWIAHTYLAAAYAMTGQPDLARAGLSGTEQYFPGGDLHTCLDVMLRDFQPGPELDHFTRGLAAAGFPL